MEIDIRSLRLEPTPVLRRYIERRLRHALRSFRDRVERVTVRLTQDQGHSRRGIRRCEVTVSACGLEPLRIEERHGSIYAAFGRAMAQTKRALARAVDRGHRVSRARLGKGLARGLVTESPEGVLGPGRLTSTLPS